MTVRARVEWPSRQMYSKRHPIGRAQVFAAFAKALEAATGEPASEPALIEQVDVEGVEHLGYWAAKLLYELRAGELRWTCWITPILASMGVSGEEHAWVLHGARPSLAMSGAARSAARQPSFAELTIERCDPALAARVERAFVEAIGRVLTEQELESES
ncbi:MAG: hypothetical protein U0269_22915 [Polyangiales bacterium]